MNIFIKTLSLFLAAIIQYTSIFQLPFLLNGDYAEPIDSVNGGDPFIVECEGETYYTFTTGNGIVIRKTVSLSDTTAIEEKTVYSQGNDGILWDIWAPEIHKIGNRWYIVACALFDKNAVPPGAMPEAEEFTDSYDCYRYGFVLESKTDDIFGEYEFKGMLAPDGLNNIDGTYLQKNGRLYYVCSAYVKDALQCIYIAEMENPYTLKEDENGQNNAVMLTRPEFAWEKKGWWVNEGPAVLYKGDSVYLLYSASGFSSGGYCMGMLTLNGDDVTDPSCWQKRLTPVFSKKPMSGIYHPGHCSFLYRENGDIYMVYHATDNKDFGASPRCTYIKRIEFFGNYPIFL